MAKRKKPVNKFKKKKKMTLATKVGIGLVILFIALIVVAGIDKKLHGRGTVEYDLADIELESDKLTPEAEQFIEKYEKEMKENGYTSLMVSNDDVSLTATDYIALFEQMPSYKLTSFTYDKNGDRTDASIMSSVNRVDNRAEMYSTTVDEDNNVSVQNAMYAEKTDNSYNGYTLTDEEGVTYESEDEVYTAYAMDRMMKEYLALIDKLGYNAEENSYSGTLDYIDIPYPVEGEDFKLLNDLEKVYIRIFLDESNRPNEIALYDTVTDMETLYIIDNIGTTTVEEPAWVQVIVEQKNN